MHDIDDSRNEYNAYIIKEYQEYICMIWFLSEKRTIHINTSASVYVATCNAHRRHSTLSYSRRRLSLPRLSTFGFLPGLFYYRSNGATENTRPDNAKPYR